MATSIVKVYNSRYNEWADNARVELQWDGIRNLGFSRTVYTNRNGVAEIDHSSTGECTVYVNGQKTRTTFYAPNTITVTI